MHDATTAAIEEVPPPKPQPKLCGIFACFRPHKENHPPVEPQPAQAPSKPTQQDTNDDSRPNKRKAHPFNILDDSPELAQLFKRYPGLPTKLTNIHVATLPPAEEQPGRGGLPWNLQQAPGYQHKKPKWTHDLGLRRGKEALRKARTDPGEDGDAVREYCELVLHLLSKQEATGGITDLVREQVVKQDVQLIEQLIEAESKWT
ncbi:putative hit finger domain protein [Diaporthe ampelina]|uniref:Putative hit finger domain protein n=1 Tax=Diaporthe ampelina TaxID=1214573 RepID=A0A0G2HTA6_9PEZI|nr:putative hit finger domain protein [Diaporthe ampelina]